MSKKNRALSDENLGQVAGGARQYNDDGKLELDGQDAEIAKRALAAHDLRGARKNRHRHNAGGPTDGSGEPSQGDMINNLYNN